MHQSALAIAAGWSPPRARSSRRTTAATFGRFAADRDRKIERIRASGD